MQAGVPNSPGGPVSAGDSYQLPPAPKKATPVWLRIVYGIAGIVAIISGLSEIFGGGHNVDYGKDNIRYYHDATRADADALAKALTSEPYFGTNANGVSVLLDKKGDAITLSFVVNDKTAGDPQSLRQFQGIAVDVAAAVPGKLTTIRLVDQSLNEKQTTTDIAGGGHDAKYGKDDIRYYHDATQADADALAKALKDATFFGGNATGLSVLLDKTGDAITLSFVVDPVKAKDPETIKGFQDLATGVAKSIPGRLTTLKLIDSELHEVQSIRMSTWF